MAATALGNRKRHIRDEPMLPGPKRKAVGRISKYKPEYCDIAEQMGKQGKSLSQIAAIFNVDRASLNRWASEHEGFAQSLARAKTYEQAWWEAKAQSSLGRKHFQAQLWRHSMAGRFKEDYAERPASAGVEGLGDLLLAVEEVAQRRAAAMLPGASAKPVDILDVEISAPKAPVRRPEGQSN